MKTTVDIADALFESVRRVAAREGTTLRALIEEGLRVALERRKTPSAFHLRNASFAGDGLRSGVDFGDWDRVRSLTYDDKDA